MANGAESPAGLSLERITGALRVHPTRECRTLPEKDTHANPTPIRSFRHTVGRRDLRSRPLPPGPLPRMDAESKDPAIQRAETRNYPARILVRLPGNRPHVDDAHIRTHVRLHIGARSLSAVSDAPIKGRMMWRARCIL
jgi:hypothetical protein